MTANSPDLSPGRLATLRARAIAGAWDAQFLLAEACEHGRVVWQSATAARQGDSAAAFRRGLLLLRDGEKLAAYLIALCFAQGVGVERDRAAAYRWMLIAWGPGQARAARQSGRLAHSLSPQIVATINLEVLEFAAAQAHQRAQQRLRIK